MNYLAILVCAVLAMVIGFIWYGPLFGKKWMELTGADKMSEEERKVAMNGMWKLPLTQLILTLVQVYILSWYITSLDAVSFGLHTAFYIWIAFVMPTIAGTTMWNGESTKKSWTRFFIQSGYQLVIFLMFGMILSAWR